MGRDISLISTSEASKLGGKSNVSDARAAEVSKPNLNPLMLTSPFVAVHPCVTVMFAYVQARCVIPNDLCLLNVLFPCIQLLYYFNMNVRTVSVSTCTFP